MWYYNLWDFFFNAQPLVVILLCGHVSREFYPIEDKEFQFLKVPLLHKDLKSHLCPVKLKKLDTWEWKLVALQAV